VRAGTRVPPASFARPMPFRRTLTRAFVALSLGATAASAQRRTIAIDERLAADAGLRLGSRVVLSALPGDAARGDTVIVGAITRQGADPSEVARAEYRVRLHLDQLQTISGYGNRVDRFAVGAPGERQADSAVAAINRAAFGFRAYRSRDVAVETSRTFQVVTIAASGIFLLCILLLKVEERRRDVAALRLMGVSRASVVRSVVLEAALVSVLGSALGVAVGWVTTIAINWHYRGVYRTPLAFALVTPDIVAFAVGLSLVLGIGAGYLAARRLVRTPPLALFGR
jgi:putative ABC transport system permease protein